MLNGLFNRLYVGKNRKDVEPEDISTNPVQVFFEVLGVRYLEMVKLSLLHLIFSLPAILWTYYMVVVVLNMGENEVLESYLLIYLAGMIPGLMIAGLGRAGMAAVCSRFARDQSAWVVTDFFAGIKENWKQSLGASFITTAALWVGTYLILFDSYLYSASQMTIFMILSYILVVLVVFVFAVNIYFWPMMVTYNMSFKTLVRYSFLLMIARFPFTFLFGILFLLLPVFFIWLWFMWAGSPFIAFLIYGLFGFAFFQYLLSAYAWNTFKRFIRSEEEKLNDDHQEQRAKSAAEIWKFVEHKDK